MTISFKRALLAAAFTSSILLAPPVAAEPLVTAPDSRASEKPAILVTWLAPFAHAQSQSYSLEVASFRLITVDMDEPAASKIEAAAFAAPAACVDAGLLKRPSFADAAISCREVEHEPSQHIAVRNGGKIALKLAASETSGAAE